MSVFLVVKLKLFDSGESSREFVSRSDSLRSSKDYIFKVDLDLPENEVYYITKEDSDFDTPIDGKYYYICMSENDLTYLKKYYYGTEFYNNLICINFQGQMLNATNWEIIPPKFLLFEIEYNSDLTGFCIEEFDTAEEAKKYLMNNKPTNFDCYRIFYITEETIRLRWKRRNNYRDFYCFDQDTYDFISENYKDAKIYHNIIYYKNDGSVIRGCQNIEKTNCVYFMRRSMYDITKIYVKLPQHIVNYFKSNSLPFKMLLDYKFNFNYSTSSVYKLLYTVDSIYLRFKTLGCNNNSDHCLHGAKIEAENIQKQVHNLHNTFLQNLEKEALNQKTLEKKALKEISEKETLEKEISEKKEQIKQKRINKKQNKPTEFKGSLEDFISS